MQLVTDPTAERLKKKKENSLRREHMRHLYHRMANGRKMRNQFETPSSTPPSQLKRYHSFDSLRATMMLLGLVLHTAANYITFPIGDNWPYKDAQTSPAFDILVAFIHTFRMPTFFVIAGFFAAFQYDTRGASSLFHNRLKRIGLPLMGGWFILFPLVIASSIFANMQMSVPFESRPEDMTLGAIFDHLMHLWFLYDLLIFYSVALLSMPLIERIPQEIRHRVSDSFRTVASKAWGPLFFSVVTLLTLYSMQTGTLDVSDSFLPAPRVLCAYGVFFTFGWFLYQQRTILDTFSPRAWRSFTAGTVFFGLYIVLAEKAFTAYQAGTPSVAFYLAMMSALAAAIWFLIYGFIGLFLRYLEKPIPLGRYLADASYWMYLVHLPFTILLPALLASVQLPAIVKFSLVLSVTTAITLATYHYWVRSTFIGEALNGRRYPRKMPQYGL